jgi:hypothetical protein
LTLTGWKDGWAIQNRKDHFLVVLSPHSCCRFSSRNGELDIFIVHHLAIVLTAAFLSATHNSKGQYASCFETDNIKSNRETALRYSHTNINIIIPFDYSSNMQKKFQVAVVVLWRNHCQFPCAFPHRAAIWWGSQSQVMNDVGWCGLGGWMGGITYPFGEVPRSAQSVAWRRRKMRRILGNGEDVGKRRLDKLSYTCALRPRSSNVCLDASAYACGKISKHGRVCAEALSDRLSSSTCFRLDFPVCSV